MPKILVTRTDRLGDALCSLPALEYLRQQIPADEMEIEFWCSEPAAQALGPYLRSRHYQIRSHSPSPEQWRDYLAGLFLFAEPSTLRAAAKGGLPVRIGLRSRPSSFWRLNHGLRLSRARGDRHESSYNLALARYLVELIRKRPCPPQFEPVLIPSEDAEREGARRALESLGVSPESGFVVLHPGMGGSALSPSETSFQRLTRRLSERCRLVLSEGPGARDQELVGQLNQTFPELPVLRHLPLGVIREVFRMARAVIAPSTGPLHLAHYVGTPTFGIYPPIRSQNPARWAPRGGPGPSRVYAPAFPCPARRQCLGRRCRAYPCMDGVDWGDLILSDAGDCIGEY